MIIYTFWTSFLHWWIIWCKSKTLVFMNTTVHGEFHPVFVFYTLKKGKQWICFHCACAEAANQKFEKLTIFFWFKNTLLFWILFSMKANGWKADSISTFWIPTLLTSLYSSRFHQFIIFTNLNYNSADGCFLLLQILNSKTVVVDVFRSLILQLPCEQ